MTQLKIPGISIAVVAAAVVLFLIFPVSAQDTGGYIIVGVPPSADFVASYAYTTVPTLVMFYDQSTGTMPLTYLWDFGDGTTSTEQNPMHSYTRKGMFTVSLTVTNAYGTDRETKTDYLRIGYGPTAVFEARPLSGTIPLPVAFSDMSVGNPTAWLWDFGDGTRSSEQNPIHTYSETREFTITLTASNEYGSSTASKVNYITVNPAVKARFTADKSSGQVPLTVKFTDTSFGNPTSWSWDFGDGTTSSEKNPVHTYETVGNYDVKLTASSATDSDSTTGMINAGGVPATDFTADKTAISLGETIKFTDLTGNNPASWSWDFGDGTGSMEQNPAHTYLAPGIYTVSLTTKNANGKDTETKVNYINVGLKPVADFISNRQVIDVPEQVRFIDITTNNPTSWSWDFGDGGTSAEQNPQHVYFKGGLYTVSLTATNAFGESMETKSDYIYAGFAPVVDFEANKLVVLVNEPVQFTDMSKNFPTVWQWDFGDGQTDSVPNPVHRYLNPGVYSVTLRAFNDYSMQVQKNYYVASKTKESYITVRPGIVADFTVDRTVASPGTAFTFTDTSRGSPTAWAWDFGDGTKSSDQNPVHSFSATGTYSVTLKASNNAASDTITKTNLVTITQGPVAEFTVTSRQGKAPFIVVFRDLSTGSPTSWYWEFGDGATSTDRNPVHVYQMEGAYDVRLTVSNQYGQDSILKSASAAETTPSLTGQVTSESTSVPAAAQTPVSRETTAVQTKSPVSVFALLIALGSVLLASYRLPKRK